ncbi:hypothetical protein EBR43_14110 [bacterium]|nr:hypothetical protein [bacterium]
MAKTAKKKTRPVVKTKNPMKKEAATVKTAAPKDQEPMKVKTTSQPAPYLLPKGRLITAEGWKRQMILAAKK